MRDSFKTRLLSAQAPVMTLALLLSCASPSGLPGYRYFETPAPDDPWSVKIGQWQTSQQAEGTPDVAAGPHTPLREEYITLRSQLREELARKVALRIQADAARLYSEDEGVDHWPTLEEVLASSAEDCDGLELVAHRLLIDLGFPEDRIFRAVVHRVPDGQYHMVTLWFDDPNDPWVIDPTGAMAMGMPRMSQIPDWIPLKLFSKTEEFSVQHFMRSR